MDGQDTLGTGGAGDAEGFDEPQGRVVEALHKEHLERGIILANRADVTPLNGRPIPQLKVSRCVSAKVELLEVAGVLGMQRAEVLGQKAILHKLRFPRFLVHG
jgi:hypothetical protein